MDAQCDELTVDVVRTKLIILAVVDMPWRKKNQKIGLVQSLGQSSRGKKVALIFGGTRIPVEHTV